MPTRGSIQHRRILDEPIGIVRIGLQHHPVGNVAGAGHEAADQHRRGRLAGAWVSRDAHAVDQGRRIEERSLGGIEPLERERRRFFHLHEVRVRAEPDAQIDAQFRGGLPRILNEPLERACVAVAAGARRLFGVRPEHAEQRVRIGVTAVEGVRGVSREVETAGKLVGLPAFLVVDPLHVETGLERVPARA